MDAVQVLGGRLLPVHLEDAVVVDSTDLDREGVVDRVVELALTTVGAVR